MTPLQQQAAASAKAALNFYLRNQITKDDSADRGRYPFIVNCPKGQVEDLTSNWLSGIMTSAMLNAYQEKHDRIYLDSATEVVRFLRSMQDFSPWKKRTQGAIHECLPMDIKAHPRDGLSAALGMLDYYRATSDQECLRHAQAFGDWFITIGMEPGYPYWTVRFDDKPWEPFWHGSFHSGSAFFLIRLAATTQDKKYLDAAEKLLSFYNTNMLSAAGDITVIRRHGTLENLDQTADPFHAPIGWIMMHKYNDDFGALANLACTQATGKKVYQDKAVLFLERMKQQQRPDGGFGPAEWQESIPDAAGIILLELLNARKVGAIDDSFAEMTDRTVEYLISIQFRQKDHPFDGAFPGLNGHYEIDPNYCNARTTTYAVMSLLQYAGVPAVNYCL